MKDVIIPPMLIQIIDSGITGMEGKIFDKAKFCPHCRGELYTHDYRKKKFATRIVNGNLKPVYVKVKRFRCKNCGKLVYADEPFYPEIRTGAPIVDFCIANKNRHSYHQISRILRYMNISVSPSSVTNFASAEIIMPPVVEMYGIFFPASLLNLSNVGFPYSPENCGANPTGIIQK